MLEKTMVWWAGGKASAADVVATISHRVSSFLAAGEGGGRRRDPGRWCGGQAAAQQKSLASELNLPVMSFVQGDS